MLIDGTEDRKRFVFNEWVRDPKGPYLTKPPPHGKRTTNGMIWGNSSNDFFWIRRLPGVDVMTIWSRSMIRQFGENVLHEEDDYEPDPRQLHPYPRLGLLVDESHAIYVGMVDIAKYVERNVTNENNKIGLESESSDVRGENSAWGDDGDISASNDSYQSTAMKVDDEGDQTLKDSNAKSEDGIIETQNGTTVSKSADEMLQSNTAEKMEDVQEDSGLNAGRSELIEKSQMTSTDDVVTSAPPRNAETPIDITLTESTMPHECDQRELPEERIQSTVDVLQDASMNVEDSDTNENERVDDIQANVHAGTSASENALGSVESCEVEKDERDNASDLAPKSTQMDADGLITDSEADGKVDDTEEDAQIHAKSTQVKNIEKEDNDLSYPTVNGEQTDAEPQDTKSDNTESEPCSEETEDSDEDNLLGGLSENQYFIYKPSVENFKDKPMQAEDENTEEDIGICARYRPSSLPKLEEKIPSEFFPDVLLVNDPDGVTYGRESQHWKTQRDGLCEKPKSKPIRYQRRYPRPDMTSTKDSVKSTPLVANLDLSSAPLLGVGNHSRVHRGALRPPHPLVAKTPTGELAVAAKVSFPYNSALELLQNEAKIYNAFPEHLMEHWSGLNLVTPLQNPVPVGAVVPRFYGYYYPVDENNIEGEDRGAADRMKCASRRWGRSPILLLEECGTPIEPHAFGPDDRSECFSLCLRLHYADFIQRSFYTRNILKQPGPLTEPQHLRSWSTPAFRVIDFGRGESWNLYQKGKTLSEASNEWWTMREHEKRKAERELEMTPFAYQ